MPNWPVKALLVYFLSTSVLPGQSVPHGKEFKLDCKLCHNTQTWQVETDSIQFDHNSTLLQLAGKHLAGSCRDCHSDLVFKGTPVQCFSCHADPHESEMGFSCEECHTSKGWIDKDKFREYHKTLQFPLTGIHAQLDCDDCHPQKRYSFAKTPLNCFGCHSQDYFASQNPNHLKAGLSTGCSECHTPEQLNWNKVNYNHNTDFRLQGWPVPTATLRNMQEPQPPVNHVIWMTINPLQIQVISSMESLRTAAYATT